jgi:hypothetical protein
MDGGCTYGLRVVGNDGLLNRLNLPLGRTVYCSVLFPPAWSEHEVLLQRRDRLGLNLVFGLGTCAVPAKGLDAD